MIYTVIWLPEAEAALAQIWEADQSARSAVTASAHELDQLLGTDPVGASESREGKLRIILVPPPGASFSYSNDDRKVWVGEVWRYDKRRK
jgi:hypothetical protein